MPDAPQGAALTAAHTEPETPDLIPFDPAMIDHLRDIDAGHITLFSPRDDTTGAFLALLRAAKQSALISIYGFTLAEAADVLIAKHQAGVSVRILFDHTQACGPSERAQVARLAAAGVPHWIGTSPKAGQILHSKVTVVDGVLTETGSWNYSASASKEFNTLVLAKDPQGGAKLTAYVETLIAWVQEHDARWQSVVPNIAEGVPA